MLSLDETLLKAAGELNLSATLEAQGNLPEPEQKAATEPKESLDEPESEESLPQELGREDDSEKPSEPPVEDKAPGRWKPAAKERWAALDPVVKDEIRRREDDFHKGIEIYKADAGRGKAFEKAVSPFMANIQATGVAPEQAVASLLAFEHALRNGTPEQKLTILQNTAKSYGIDLSALTRQQESQPYVDPEVAKLRAEQQAMLQRMQAKEEAERQSQEMVLVGQVEAFSKAEGHEHFEAVRPAMAALLQAGQAKDLDDAYQKAVWADPEIRSTLLAKQREEERKAAAKAKAKQGSGVNVARRGTQPLNRQKPLSLDETLKSAFFEINGR